MADVSVEARERMKTEYIREDRTVEGWYIETHYTPCKGIADANGYLRVLVDEEGYDTETRILHETLNGIGWVKSAALSANNQERAEAVAPEIIEKLAKKVGMGFYKNRADLSDYSVTFTRDNLQEFCGELLAATSTTPQAPTAEPLISKEWLAEKLAACHDDAIGASQPKRPCDTPPGCNAGNCLRCGEVKPTAEPVDPAYPFYELKFIMRVLSHKGGAPKQDWDTAYGMAREIFSRWHKDRQSTAEGQPNRDWDHIDDVLPVIELMRSGKWVWDENMRCKYVEVRIDTRDGGCIIKDRHDVRITPAELVKQFDGRGGLSWTEYDEIFSPPIAKQQEPS